MTLFRPERTVTDPEGRTWEIYVTRSSFLSRLHLADAPRTVEIEAVCFFPGRTSHRWQAASDNAGAVVEQIVVALEAGEIARPLGTTYQDPRMRPGQGPPSLDGD